MNTRQRERTLIRKAPVIPWDGIEDPGLTIGKILNNKDVELCGIVKINVPDNSLKLEYSEMAKWFLNDVEFINQYTRKQNNIDAYEFRISDTATKGKLGKFYKKHIDDYYDYKHLNDLYGRQFYDKPTQKSVVLEYSTENQWPSFCNNPSDPWNLQNFNTRYSHSFSDELPIWIDN